MRVTHYTQTKMIVILTIENKIKWNKINNNDNTNNNNNDDSNNNKSIIPMIVIIKIIPIMIIIIMITASKQLNSKLPKTKNLLSCQIIINKILYAD